MKNVLMILVLLGGIAINNLEAQKCNVPCPPGCKVTSCCVYGYGSSSVSADTQPDAVTLASFLIGGNDNRCSGQKMTSTDTKSCLASCQTLGQKAPSDNIHTADANLSRSQLGPTPSVAPAACQPACKSAAIASLAIEPAPQPQIKKKS